MSLKFSQVLSSLSVDLVSLSEYLGGRFAVIQRDPQPAEIDIKYDTTIRMTLADLEGDDSSVALGFGHNVFGNYPFGHSASGPGDTGFDFDVYVQGILALSWNYSTSTATFSNGFSGTVVQSGAGSPYFFYLVEIVPPSVFLSEEQITVRTVILPMSPALDEEYSFVIEDLTPPSIIDAYPIDQKTIRVTFDDNMMVDGDGTALDVSAYSIIRHNEDPVPGVNLEVVSVSEVEGSDQTQFDLVVNWEQTPECLYQIIVSHDVEDTSGNNIDTGDNVFFNGFKPVDVDRRNFSHWKQMIPLKNRLEDNTRDAERFSNCIQEVMELLLHSIDHFTDQFDPDLCSDEQIDLMLYDMGNPFDWADLDLTATQKRKLLRVLIDIYLSKGTAIGIEQTILFLLGIEVSVEDYLSEGWVLGVDALGEGEIAQLPVLSVGPYDFSSVSQPWELLIDIDGDGEQTLVFVSGDFADDSNATAEEVVDVINAQITGGGAYVVNDGQPALISNGVVGPFSMPYGETITIAGPLDTSPAVSYTFKATDYSDENNISAADIVSVLFREFPEIEFEVNPYKGIIIRTIGTDDSNQISISGSALPYLGFVPVTSNGKYGKRFYIYSNKYGVDASVECTNPLGSIPDGIFRMWIMPSVSTGATILAPDDSYTKYSFDIVTGEVLDSDVEILVRRIAEYMKPAHTHLINIRTERTLPWSDDWEIGIGQLDENTSLAQ